MKLTIVIPAHNEEESLPNTLENLQKEVSVKHEIIVVDDHSSDNTAKVVGEFSAQYPNIRLVTNDTPPGFTNAIKKGFSQVKEGFVVPIMADNCDDPKTVNFMYERMKEGYDVVCASRYMRGGEKIGGRPLQTLFSRFCGLSLYFLTKIPIHDASNAFKMYRKEALDTIEIKEAGFACSLEIVVKLYQKGYKVAEIPTRWKDRVAGKSNFRIGKVIKNYIRWYIWAIFIRPCDAYKK